ncbi:MAG: SRPBCC domain-containing protein [Paracoccaceae bacterium]
MTDLTLSVERTIQAAQKDVFDAWLNPDMLRRFMMPAAEMTVPVARTEPKQGGRFEIVMRAGDNDIPHAGTYLEIDPHERIVFTWESPYSADDSTVTLLFAPDGDGTRVTLTHVRFVDEQTRDNHKGGWTSILDALNGALT